MYANISDYHFRPGSDAQQLIQRTEQEAMPLAEQVPGFRAYYFVRVADDRVLAISLWDSQADWEETLPRLMPWLQENVAPQLAREPERTAGDVVIERRK